MSLNFFKNYENIGKNRLCLTGEQYPHIYTDKYFKKLGFSSELEVIILSILYIKENKKLTDLLFGKITLTMMENLKNNKIQVSEKQMNILISFIKNDLNSLILDFPNHKIIEKEMKKVFNYYKCLNNSHNNIIPLLSEEFKELLN